MPPFFPSFVLFARPPKPERVRAPARRHPRPQPLARRLLRRVPRAARRHRPDLPERRRRRDRRRDAGSRSTACAAACCCRTIPPDVDVGEAALRPRLRPALGGVRGPRACPSTATAAPARPTTARTRSPTLLYITEVGFYSQRPFVQLLLSGVFERFPQPEVRDDRDGLRVAPAAARPARRACITQIRTTGRDRRAPLHATSTSCRRSATEYFHQNCWIGVSQPGPADAAARDEIGLDRFMWGSDYPHDEGTVPVHARAPAPAVPRHRARRAAADPRRQRGASSTTSTSTRWRRSRTSSGRRSPSSRSRSTSCPRTRTSRSSAVHGRRSSELRSSCSVGNVTLETVEPHISVITLNRPDRLNALTFELTAELLRRARRRRCGHRLQGRGPHRRGPGLLRRPRPARLGPTCPSPASTRTSASASAARSSWPT